MKSYKDFLTEAKIAIDEDTFDDYKFDFVIPEENNIDIKKWLITQTRKVKDEFVQDALEDVLSGMIKNNNYKTGINFTVNGKPFSIYSYKKRVFLSSPKPINKNTIKDIFGV